MKLKCPVCTELRDEKDLHAQCKACDEAFESEEKRLRVEVKLLRAVTTAIIDCAPNYRSHRDFQAAVAALAAFDRGEA